MSAATEWCIEEPIEDDSSSSIDRQAQRREAAAGRRRSTAAARQRSREDTAPTDDRSWNVLAKELVAYPPAHRRIFLDLGDDRARPASRQHESGNDRELSYGEAWLEGERERLRARAAQALLAPTPQSAPRRSHRSSPVTGAADLLRSEPLTRTTRPHRLATHPTRSPARRARAERVAVQRHALAAAAEPRGLRRLLPGVATLAVLAGVWLGGGALAGLHHPVDRVLPGSIATTHGYVYVARAGDTLWSIASAVQPGSDPRTLVAQLEQQLHGLPLVPGDHLRLP